MAREYELTPLRRLLNWLARFLIQLGLPPKHREMLQVRGRKTGKLYSTPIALVDRDGERYLVAPYGEVGWVRNARAAGKVTLSRGRKSQTYALEEVRPDESAPVLREYIRIEPITRPFFAARESSPLEEFAAEAEKHPVFRLKASP